MEDERVDETTGFDLNMEPLGLLTNELEDVYYSNILRGRSRLDEVSGRPRSRWRRWRPGRTPAETRNISLEMIMNPSTTVGEGGGLLVGEGSEVRVDSSKTGKRKSSIDLVAKALGKQVEVEKESSDEGMRFFDCYICLEMANDPVLTCCGHLFCWPCLYQWLHVHSSNKVCPVCQGEVKETSIMPIYGRGNDNKEPGKESGSDIPPRPQARRVESLRQRIRRAVSSSFPIEEMIERIGRRLDEEGETGQPGNSRLRANELLERTSLLTRQMIQNRAIRREESTRRNSNLELRSSRPVEDVLVLTQDNVVSSEAVGTELLPSGRPILRTRSQRAASLTRLSSELAERLAGSQAQYFNGDPMPRTHPRSSPIEDRDSVSGVAQSESPTVDTAAAELDPGLSLSSSDTSRTSSYLGSRGHRAPRRRRLSLSSFLLARTRAPDNSG